jgi:hypothetical protein
VGFFSTAPDKPVKEKQDKLQNGTERKLSYSQVKQMPVMFQQAFFGSTVISHCPLCLFKPPGRREIPNLSFSRASASTQKKV